MRPATFTPELRRAGVFPRRMPYTSLGEWQGARASLIRGVWENLAIGTTCLALLGALTLGSTWTQAFLFGTAAPSGLEHACLLVLAGLSVWVLGRAIRVGHQGIRLARSMAPLPRAEAQALLAQVRAEAPGLMRSLVHWESETGIPLLQVDRVQVAHGIQTRLFELGHRAHGVQQTPYDATDAALTLAWETEAPATVTVAA